MRGRIDVRSHHKARQHHLKHCQIIHETTPFGHTLLPQQQDSPPRPKTLKHNVPAKRRSGFENNRFRSGDIVSQRHKAKIESG